MTGSISFHRQRSSNDSKSNTEKTSQPKLRRCSSAEEHHNMEPIPDEVVDKIKGGLRRDYPPSDTDSGTEDLELQPILMPQQVAASHDEQCDQFGACEDEGYAEEGKQTPVPETQNEEDVLETIRSDCKWEKSNRSNI